MTSGIVITIVVGVLATTLVYLVNRHRKVTMAVVAPLYGMLVIGAIVFLQIRENDLTRQLSQREETIQEADYRFCLQLQTRGSGNLKQHQAINRRLLDRGLIEDADYLDNALKENLLDNALVCIDPSP